MYRKIFRRINILKNCLNFKKTEIFLKKTTEKHQKRYVKNPKIEQIEKCADKFSKKIKKTKYIP